MISAAEVSQLFGPWMVDKTKGVSLSHVFISYRQGKDTDFVSYVFDTFTKLTFGPNHEAIDVFADTVRLRLGRDFQADFIRSLVNSQIVMPLVTNDALTRMQADKFNPQVTNNLLFSISCHNNKLCIYFMLYIICYILYNR